MDSPKFSIFFVAAKIKSILDFSFLRVYLFFYPSFLPFTTLNGQDKSYFYHKARHSKLDGNLLISNRSNTLHIDDKLINNYFLE